MTEMIDRAVETLRKLPIRDFQNPGSELDNLRLREAVRAVFESMREPTSDMKWAAMGASPENKTWGEVDELRWKAMIDAARGLSPSAP